MLWSAAAMGMGSRARLLRVVLPAALPEIMVGIRTGLVLALITMVTSEMIARQQRRRRASCSTPRMAQYADGLRHDHDHRHARLRASMPRSRSCAAGVVAWAEPAHDIAVGST